VTFPFHSFLLSRQAFLGSTPAFYILKVCSAEFSPHCVGFLQVPVIQTPFGPTHYSLLLFTLVACERSFFFVCFAPFDDPPGNALFFPPRSPRDHPPSFPPFFCYIVFSPPFRFCSRDVIRLFFFFPPPVVLLFKYQLSSVKFHPGKFSPP